jgi:hypothetical protein
MTIEHLKRRRNNIYDVNIPTNKAKSDGAKAPINFDRISDHVSLAQDILAAHQTPETLTTLSILGSYVKCPHFLKNLHFPFCFDSIGFAVVDRTAAHVVPPHCQYWFTMPFACPFVSNESQKKSGLLIPVMLDEMRPSISQVIIYKLSESVDLKQISEQGTRFPKFDFWSHYDFEGFAVRWRA